MAHRRTAMIGNAILRMFLLPGELVAGAIGVREGDDRAMVRTLVNMLVWNLVGVMVVVLW
jgi:hypothetical protein